MAALGLKWGELGIGAHVYGGLQDDFEYPEDKGQQIVHDVTNVTTFPTQDLGHARTFVSGTFVITATNLIALITDIRTGTSERKISWLDLDDTEVYGYAKGGSYERRCLNYGARGDVVRIYEVTFTIPLTRTKIYYATTDAVAWES